MNILDIIILICLIPAIIQGLKKGFISQVLSIISIIVGIWMSSKFANVVGEWVAQYITASEQVIRIVSFAIILIGVSLLLAALGKVLESVLNLVMLGWVNKLLGLVFAVLKTVLILGFVVIIANSVITSLGTNPPAIISESILYPYINDIADSVFPYIKDMLSLK